MATPILLEQPTNNNSNIQPSSSSVVSHSSPSSYTPSSDSVSSFDWFSTNPLILQPTAPDLSFSFQQPSSNTQSTKHFCTLKLSANSQEELPDDHDHDEHHKEPSATPPFNSPTQTLKKPATPKHSSSRPLSQYLELNSSTLTTPSEKVKSRKSLGFLLGTGTGRLRSSTCLESQLEDVLNSQQSSLPFAAHHQPHTPTTIYRLPTSEPATRPSTTRAHYQKSKNRLSAFLSFLPADQASSTTPTAHQHTPERTHSKNPNRRPSVNLLDRATLSFRPSNSATHPSPYLPSPPPSSKSPPKLPHSPPTGKSPYIRSSRSFLNLLSSKLK